MTVIRASVGHDRRDPVVLTHALICTLKTIKNVILNSIIQFPIAQTIVRLVKAVFLK